MSLIFFSWFLSKFIVDHICIITQLEGYVLMLGT